MKQTIVTVLLTIVPIILHAQGDAGAQLREARSLKCSFPAVVSLDVDSAEAGPEVGSQSFGFYIDSIDHQGRKARMIGNAGASDLAIIDGHDVLTFVEQTPTGNVMVTTVFPVRVVGTNGFRAVHSRHTYLLNSPLPSQAYGTCEIWGE